MDPDSKYSVVSKADKNNGVKHSLKLKPTPVLFNHKNGASPSKKMKLQENGNGNNKFVNNLFRNNNNNRKPKINIQEQRRKLPVFKNRQKLIELIKQHKTLVILGETGSGKTTQIPQFIHGARLTENSKIAITQPRRVAAISVAMRVSQEFNNGMDVGELVGYSVRFEDVTSKKTKIKYLTDGMLLRESISDKLLMEYSVVILDEAHERTVHTDVLFGVVKNAQRVREERGLVQLKVIIMSATMDVDHFSKYFNNCQAVYLEGRTYPVNIMHSIKQHDNYQTSCVATFFKIHSEAPAEHDVLIFLTGQEEIEVCAQQIRLLAKDPQVLGPPIKVFTLYAAQSNNQQMTVFHPSPAGTRKVIIATNIAETSVTISGIKYVIDSGMCKVRTFHPSTGLEILKVQRISQEQAWQRAGRAGRESDGICYRIYSKAQFELMKPQTIPEIQRANLNSVALQLLALGIHMLHFDFMDAPPKDAIHAAFDQLKLLGAIDSPDTISLTELGKKMSQFPLDPRFSKILLSAQEYGCLVEALTIVALLSGESILINAPNSREKAQNSRQKFVSPYGDHLILLNIYRAFVNVGENNKRNWCTQHYIHLRNILHAREIRTQLEEICRRQNLLLSSCGSAIDKLRKCLLTGLFMNVAELQKDRQYVTLDKKQVAMIHPSSNLHGQQPQYVIFTEVVQTSKCYLRGLTTIEGAWLGDVAPEYVNIRNIKWKICC